MIPVQLSLKNKNILIYGAGKTALNKTKQFLKEGANITIRSLSFNEEFQTLNVQCEKKQFQKEDFSSFFMIYAATDDKNINQEIIKEANRQNILCGSVNKDDNSTFHSVGYMENEDFIIALSSKNRFPYLKPIIEKINSDLSLLHPKMELLYSLRNKLLAHISKEERKEYMHQLFECDNEYLSFLKDTLETGHGHLYVYHENDENFKNKLQKDLLKKPYLILSIKELGQYNLLFKLKEISFIIHPLIIYYGFIYDKIKKTISYEQNKVLKPLICDKNILAGLKEYYHKDYDYYRYIVHPRTNHEFEDLFTSLQKENEELTNLDHPFVDLKENTLCIPLLTTNATHYKELQKANVNIEKSLFEIAEVQAYLIKNQE